MTPSNDTADAEVKVNPYEAIGGAPGVRRLVDRFYDVMEADPAAATIRAMHAADLGPMRDRLYEFLSAWLGGPPLYFQRPGHKCIMSAHAPFAIGEAERDQWMMCMRRAMADSGVPEEMRALLDRAFSTMADTLRSR
jgi:hemoglobin